jgi:hypothetical protein
LLVSAFSVGIYFLAPFLSGAPGFPLDDAWIHQTYARNLAWRGEWSFIPGEPSAGSTAPLWSLLLALGYALRLSPFVWAYLLGVAALSALAWLGMAVYDRLSRDCPACPRWRIAVGVFLVLEWHMVWAAASGMETLLQAVLVCAVLYRLLTPPKSWLVSGVLIGLSVWVRPDGLTLLGPALLVLATHKRSWRERGRDSVSLFAGLGLLFVPYLLFNQWLGGSWLPNTFFAKQLEYAVELSASLVSRLAEQAVLPLIGAGVLLLPGFVYLLLAAIRARDWAVLAGSVWFLGYLGLYALRLPVTYQHGRYVMPAMPVYFIWGLAGVALLLERPAPALVRRLLGRAWLISIAVVLGLFYILGANAYHNDIAVIEGEMVATARWVRSNTPPSALIAAHDIGALGYFAERRLLDLAGLVSPEVIPFIRDEARLAAYLDERQADYLITFPGWYPSLVSQAQPVYISPGMASPAQGGENMVVYLWR